MLQIYTGNGKGKTTAALGLALRAVGAGLRVAFVQFMKNVPTSELESLKMFADSITVKRYGTGAFIVNTPTQKDYECAAAAFTEVEISVKSARYGLVIADEICTALYYELIDKNVVVDLIKSCPPTTELVFTGRYAGDELINMAGVATDMREIKHCYETGVSARAGIDY